MKAKITRIETKTRGEIFGPNTEYGKPDDRVIVIHFAPIMEDGEIDPYFEANHVFNISKHPLSHLSKFVKKYGAPEEGVTVDIHQDNRGYWKITLNEDEDEEGGR